MQAAFINETPFVEKTTSEEDQSFIKTTKEGLINREKFFKFCSSVLHTQHLFDTTVLSLLEIFDEFDIEDSDDQLVEEYTGRIFFPVRIAILRTLIFYKEDHEMIFYDMATDHKALKMRSEALGGQLQHQMEKIDCSESTLCICLKPLSASQVLVCKYCNTVYCSHCSQQNCAVTLMGYINAQEIEEESEKRGISFWDEEETSDDEDESEDDDEMDEVEEEDFVEEFGEEEEGLYDDLEEETDYEDREIDVVG